MQLFDITEPLCVYISRISNSQPSHDGDRKTVKKLLGAYGKVRKHLKRYAAHKGVMLESLTVIELWTGNELHPELSGFIDRLPKPLRRSAERHEGYKGEVASRLRGLFKSLPWNTATDGDTPLSIPAFMLPIWRLLPKEGTRGRRKHPYDDSQDERLKHVPLTERGQQFLKVLIYVAKQYNVTTLESLLIKHGPNVCAAVRMLCHPRMWSTVHCMTTEMRRGLDLKVIHRRELLKVEEFPPTLRRQCEEFIRVAPSGLTAHSLCSSAKRHGVGVEPLEATTIKKYVEAIGLAFAIIPFESDLDVKDLMRVTRTERVDGDGEIEDHYCNPLVDIFRNHQTQLETDHKRRGFDSVLFREFCLAIKAVAAYNGIFSLHKRFNKSYEIREDVMRKRQIKDQKKKVFDLPWIDAQIARLGVVYDRIIRSRSYQLSDDGSGVLRARGAISLCLFYITLVTLRYMGYRQQALRNCVLGKNIVIKSCGTIIFHFEANEVKNDRIIHAEISPARHSETHGVLLNALNSYYRHVYPYLRKASRTDLRGQFFVTLKRNMIDVRPWKADDPTPFWQFFRSASARFIDFGDRVQERGQLMNPHFLRGRCADWLIDVLGLTFAQAADYLGDTEQTIRKEYVDRNRVLNATPVLDAAAAKIRERERGKDAEARQGWEERFKVAEQFYRSEMARKDAQIAALQSQINLNQQEIIDLLKGEPPRAGA